jgi:uncharacterized protein YraI
MKKGLIVISIIVIVGVVVTFFRPEQVNADHLYQQPTVAMATVTGTPVGMTATVNADQDQINIRSGPGVTYEKVGVLLAGQSAPAKGRSPGGEWIEIEYPGIPTGLAWVHSTLVTLSPGTLPIVEPPATPTPMITATIDATLASQFLITDAPTRLPTFTKPAPLSIPTYATASENLSARGVPLGMIIVALAALGIFGFLLSMLRGR